MQTGKDLPNWKGGIPLDNVGSDYRIVADKFLCIVCEKLVFNAMSCDQCEQIFCLSCYLITNKCKNCDKSTNISQLLVSEKRLLAKIKEISCINKHLGCSFTISYDNIASHVWKQCMYSFKCKDCGYLSSMIQSPIHYNQCKMKKTTEKNQEFNIKIESKLGEEKTFNKPIKERKNKKEEKHDKPSELKSNLKSDERKPKIKIEEENLICSKCKSYLFKNMSMEEHLHSYCEKNEFNCTYCKQKILSSVREAHILKCEEFPIKCEDCYNTIDKKNYPFHNFGRCFMKMLLFYEKYRNLGNKFEKYGSVLNEMDKLKESNNEKDFLNKKHQRKIEKEKKEIKFGSLQNELNTSSDTKTTINKEQGSMIKPNKLGKIIFDDD